MGSVVFFLGDIGNKTKKKRLYLIVNKRVN